MIAEIDITQSQPRLLRSYEWGLDVSETLEGAGGVGGGVGGLVVEWCYRVSGGTTSREGYAPCYDGNGNVMALVSLSLGEVVGQYEYGAFGETISVEGDWAVQGNPVRFSTKYWDAETGLLYDTHRYYEAATGRWLSRDSIGEDGGVNLHEICNNNTVNHVDVLGYHTFYNSQLEVAHAAGVAAIIRESEIYNEIKAEGKIPSQLRERGGRICCHQNSRYYATQIQGGVGWVMVVFARACDQGDQQVGWWHSHPGARPGQDDSSGFSLDDKISVQSRTFKRLPLTMTRKEGGAYVTYLIDDKHQISNGPKSLVSDGIPKAPEMPSPQKSN